MQLAISNEDLNFQKMFLMYQFPHLGCEYFAIKSQAHDNKNNMDFLLSLDS